MDPIEEIKRIGKYFDSLQRKEDAVITYSIVCDALVWSDEMPSEPFGDDSILRYLFLFRTSVITGNENQDLRQFWDVATGVFPNWPGFSDERCRQDAELTKLYFEMRDREMSAFEDALGD